ncbi:MULTISPECIES: acyltransferase family protein [unclassified Geodermatophilus]|uniref:acyltransferase family protein n=1 Tax=unclassified Geodermatophilus TaxID=2637632 RepID=UPI003EED769B
MTAAGARSSEELDRWPMLDVARAAVVAGLIFFHAALVFDTADDFYVKNDRTADLTPFAAPVVLWAMPLLFLAAGVGAWHSWTRWGTRGYLHRRLRRLLLPLVAGTVLLVPLPVWLRLRADPSYAESYAVFYPGFFRVRWDWSEFPFALQPAPDGRYFETGHLWFLVLLLVYSGLILPLLWWLGADRGRRAAQWLATAAGTPATTLIPAVIMAAVTAVLGLDEGIAAWNPLAYLMFFVAGVLVAADGRLRDAIRRDARLAGLVACAAFLLSAAILVLVTAPGADPLLDRNWTSLAGRAAFGVAGWCATLAIAGALAQRPRDIGVGGPATSSSKRLKATGYVGKAVLPWYVLHQPVVVVVAFFVVSWDLGPVAKYVIICAASVVVTLACYDLLVRRTAVTRALFAGETPRG